MDKVRFAIGTKHVFQGYDDGLTDMVGSNVLVTAHTLAEVVEHIQLDINTDEWNRVHNPPENEMDLLSFGGPNGDASIRVAPDGFTPLYRITTYGATIVQRYDPELPANSGGWKGRWVNESVIDDFQPWEDMEPGTFKPITHGFSIDPQNVAEGRGDSPLIETMADRILRTDGPPEPVEDITVVEVIIRLSNGDEADMEFAANEHQSGTSYTGRSGAIFSPVEDAISKAVHENRLWPGHANEEGLPA